MLFLSFTVSLALAADPPAACPGAQLCDDACIPLVAICKTAPPAPALVTVPPRNDLCRATPPPKAPDDSAAIEVGKIAAAAATCIVAGVLGRCDRNSPMISPPTEVSPEPPCGGPAIPAPDPGRK